MFVTTRCVAAAVFASTLACSPLGAAPAEAGDDAPFVHVGERVDPPGPGGGYIEHMDAVVARDMERRAMEASDEAGPKHGIWVIPTRRSSRYPHSGLRYATNKWGDTQMGIGFGRVVDVHGAYIAGQGGIGVWTKGLRAIGYRDGVEVARTNIFTDIDDRPDWFAMDLPRVDRIVIVADAALNGAGWYAMDDLAYTPHEGTGDAAPQRIVVDFEDAHFRKELTGSDFAGLDWETGTGDFTAGDAVEQPLVPDDLEEEEAAAPADPPIGAMGGAGTLPSLESSFQGVLRGDAGSLSYPPDTNGAIGPDHFVITVNRNFAVYDRDGNELINVLLGSFLPGSNGDPRVIYDQYVDRWFVLVTDFSATETMFIAVSRTNDPTGAWYKDTFYTNESGCWPDYPTLGYDEQGYYVASWMVGCDMTIWMLEKAPLIDASPSLGVITAFRDLPFDGAIHPTSTFGDPGGEYFVSRRNSTNLRIRQRTGDITSPTLTELGSVSIPSHSSPPDVPALGSNSPLDHTTSHRIMNALYRNGSIWTCHDVEISNRSACRWYEIDADTLTTNQIGTVSDSSLHYLYCSIAVNSENDVAMGFSGSNANQYAGCYYTGRLHDDPPNQMADPVQYKEGTGPQNNIDGIGRNRWGDYSFTTVDPADDHTFWTVQEYGHDTDLWGTYVGVLSPSILQFDYPNGRPAFIDPAGDAIRVEIAALGDETLDASSPTLHYNPGSGFVTAPMQIVSAGVYDAVFPAIPCDTDVDYYVSATTLAGATRTDPADAPSSTYATSTDACGATCPEDLDDSGAVDFPDILAILTAWGNAGGPEDLDGSGTVDFGDILRVLGAWGPCPK